MGRGLGHPHHVCAAQRASAAFRSRPRGRRHERGRCPHSSSDVPAPAPPFSRALRIAASLCLVAAAVLNGLSQFIGSLLVPGDLSFSEQIPPGRRAPTAPRHRAGRARRELAVHAAGPAGIGSSLPLPGARADLGRRAARAAPDLGLRQRPGGGLRDRHGRAVGPFGRGGGAAQRGALHLSEAGGHDARAAPLRQLPRPGASEYRRVALAVLPPARARPAPGLPRGGLPAP